jgi:hypothetical protein
MTIGAHIYPCDMGTGSPRGYHHFQVGPNGVSCCIYCGVIPNLTATAPPPITGQSQWTNELGYEGSGRTWA